MATCPAVVIHGQGHAGRCHLSVKRDGWCHVHHPDAVNKRRAAIDQRRSDQEETDRKYRAEKTAEHDKLLARAAMFDELREALRVALKYMPVWGDQHATLEKADKL